MTISHSPLRRKRRGWWQPGNVTTGNIFVSRGSPVGVDVGGVWRDWDFAVTSGGIPWAGSDNVGRWINPELSGGYLGADEGGRWMEVG